MKTIVIILLIIATSKAVPEPPDVAVIKYFSERINKILAENPEKITESNGYESEFNQLLRKLKAVATTADTPSTDEDVTKMQKALQEFYDYKEKREILERRLNTSIIELEESLRKGAISNEMESECYKLLLSMERGRLAKTQDVEHILRAYETLQQAVKPIVKTIDREIFEKVEQILSNVYRDHLKRKERKEREEDSDYDWLFNCALCSPSGPRIAVVNYFNAKIERILKNNSDKIPETNSYKTEFDEPLKN
uniref:Uncharacterized protein n=1 Tax=Glossina palpalis gambiensis TaxID=67801 RepID=A0A1B0B0M8_9MUSC